jgi:hypothetical protein
VFFIVALGGEALGGAMVKGVKSCGAWVFFLQSADALLDQVGLFELACGDLAAAVTLLFIF